MSEVLLSIQATALYPNSLIPHAAYPDKNRGSDRAKLQKLLATSVPDIDRVDSLVGKMDEARMAEVADYYLDVRGARPLAYGALNHARMREIPVAITCSAVPDRLARTMAAALRIYGLKTAEGFGYVTERQVKGLGLDQEQAGYDPWLRVQEFAAKVGANRVVTLGDEFELGQPLSVASEADHRIIDDNLAEYLKGPRLPDVSYCHFNSRVGGVWERGTTEQVFTYCERNPNEYAVPDALFEDALSSVRTRPL